MRSGSSSVIALWIAIVTASAFGLAASAGAQQSSYSTGSSQPQVAQPEQGGVNWKGVGVGAGTIAGNLLYVPAKITYGILGGIAGGAGFLLTGGNKQVADTIWRSSLGGDYVLTPDMVAGQKPVHFSGPTGIAPADGSAYATTPAGNIGESGSNASAPPAIGAPSNSSDSTPVTHSIDSGAGPVSSTTPPATIDSATSGGYSSGSYSSSGHQLPKSKTSSLPDTSIE